MSDIDRIIKEIDEYDEPSRVLFQNLRASDAQLDQIELMKRSEGWKLIEKNIRTSLLNRINELVADDAEIQTLLALLTFTDTKSQRKVLREAIKSALPDGSG